MKTIYEMFPNPQQKWVLRWVLHWTDSTDVAMGATTDWVLGNLHRTEGSRNPSGYGKQYFL